MAMIIITWDNPSDENKVKAMEEKAKDWRETVLEQGGLESFSAFVHPFAMSQSMVSESFASINDANNYMSSPQWAQIVSEMRAMGATNIKADLWKPSPDVPVSLRP
jgi:quinol monooxygenase YgiN